MKQIKIKSLFALAAGITLLGATSCKKLEDFGDTNIRTDAATQGTTANFLTSAEVSVPGLLSSTAGGIRGSLYGQQWSETQYTDVSLYGNPQLDFGATYAGPLENLQKIIDLNSDAATNSGFNVIGTATAPTGSNGSQISIAKILKVYYIWTITDRWGDVPYSEALKGAANLTPKYDPQSEIYPHMLQDLKDANAGFDPTQAVRGDLFFPVPATPAVASAANINAQITSWKRVANTMRMLIALRMSKANPTLAASEFAAANGENLAIETNAQNLKMLFPGTTAFETNNFYSALNGRKDYAFSKTLGDILTNMADPRRGAYGSAGAPFPYGLPRDMAVAFDGSVSGNYARPFNASQIAASSPINIIPAAYTWLAKAEAAERGWITGSAATYYNTGVTLSFEQWGYASSAAAYLASPAANFATGTGGGNNIGYDANFPSVQGASAATTTNLQRIQLQRFLASFGDGIQAWSEWRRTGVPALVPTKYGVNNPKEIPRRLTYGTGEYGTNPANVAAAAARLTGGDVMSARMWWDQ